ncbi:MAG TPA: hypothetical protein VMW27_22345 [Thermoanaerobaculia bacterium]|nr:hypothetical protein [Thermoanaerobaculia bacterium]
MQSFDDRTIPSFRNTFTPDFLQRLGERTAQNVLDAVLRSPEALADLLEAAGASALERAGVLLDSRVSGE